MAEYKLITLRMTVHAESAEQIEKELAGALDIIDQEYRIFDDVVEVTDGERPQSEDEEAEEEIRQSAE